MAGGKYQCTSCGAGFDGILDGNALNGVFLCDDCFFKDPEMAFEMGHYEAKTNGRPTMKRDFDRSVWTDYDNGWQQAQQERRDTMQERRDAERENNARQRNRDLAEAMYDSQMAAQSRAEATAWERERDREERERIRRIANNIFKDMRR